MSRILVVLAAIFMAVPAAVAVPEAAAAVAYPPVARVGYPVAATALPASGCKSGKTCRDKNKNKPRKRKDRVDTANLTDEDVTAVAAVSEALVVIAIACLI